MHPHVHCSIIYTKIWKQPKHPSMDGWIKKMWCIYNGILFIHQKRMNSRHLWQHRWALRALRRWIRQIKTNAVWSYLYVELKRNKVKPSLSIEQIRGWGMCKKRVKGVKGCKLPVIKWISHRDAGKSISSRIKYPVSWGKRSEQKDSELHMIL